MIGCQETFLSKLPADLNHIANHMKLLEPIQKNTGLKIIFPPELEVKEKTETEIISKFPRLSRLKENIRGCYNPEENVVYLSKGIYCLKTTIHEHLHAASYFAHGRETEIGKATLLNDGITEFLTGYILYKRSPDCYDSWLEKEYDICGISYQDEVKVIGVLSQYVSLIDVLRLYLYNPKVSWVSAYNSFLKKYGLNDVLFYNGDLKRPRRFKDRFKTEMENVFGIDSTDFKEDVSKILDYSIFP
ncbi:MAG: hypothetical protein R6U44_11625 [Archaeoglobaceae archaeon]